MWCPMFQRWPQVIDSVCLNQEIVVRGLACSAPQIDWDSRVLLLASSKKPKRDALEGADRREMGRGQLSVRRGVRH
jgi:hypothetical protein